MKARIIYLCILLFSGFSALWAARWNKETIDWSKNPHPVVGDWGFDRPGYPKGLYIHGITVKEGQKVKNPVIYDNDVYDDVFEDELMFAMTSLGEMNLVGLIVTPVLTDFWTFSRPGWKKTAYESVDYALKSIARPQRIPPVTVGTEADSEKKGERKMSAGAELYVKLINEHYRKHPDKPLIVNIGGQSATLASAYCIDPSIADKCIVYYTDVRVYNGHYKWASELVCKNFRVVSWGDDNWWIKKKCQSEWNVLPRPDKCEPSENGASSGEWRLLTQMGNPMLSHMVEQFQKRSEYCKKEKKSDGYYDGTFLHAWIPAIFTDASLMEVRKGEVLHVTRFTEENEKKVKDYAMKILLNPKAYKRKR